MDKSEFLRQFVITYKKNRDENDFWNERLLDKTNLQGWTKILQDRSIKLRQIYKENEENLSIFRDMLREPLDDETAQMFYDTLLSLYDECYDDYDIMKSICEPLIAYYEEKDDLDHRIQLYQIMGFETTEFYCRTLGDNGVGIAVDYYQKILSLQNRYTEVTNPRARRCFFSAYSNIIAPLSEISPMIQDTLFDYYDGVVALYMKPEVRILDGDDGFLETAMNKIDEDILYAETYAERLPQRQLEAFKYIATKAHQDVLNCKREDYSGSVMRAYNKVLLLDGQKDLKTIVEEEIAALLDLPMPDFTDEEDPRLLQLLYFYFNTSIEVMNLLTKSDFSEETKRSYFDRFFSKITYVLQNIPYHYSTSLVNSSCADVYIAAEPFMKDVDERVAYLSKIIIIRQPTTYLHSLMVMQIAEVIAHTYIPNHPKDFIGILGLKSEEEVLKNVEDLKEYVANCGFLHDIGKCLMTDVINQQWRRLCGEEFELIRVHPEKGIAIINENKDFEAFFDVVVGHHKFYDGQGGYPVSFDNTASPVKIIIDLITLADSIDAATDVWCRNYARGKTFMELLGELVEGSGSRYHPGFVEEICNNSGLKSLLEYITGEGRIDTYFGAFREISALEKQ